MAAGFVSVISGDIATLRKAHACGGRAWKVTRTGADIGLQCATCGRRIMLGRDEFERRLVSVMRPEARASEDD